MEKNWVSISIRNCMFFPFLIFLERSEQSCTLHGPSCPMTPPSEMLRHDFFWSSWTGYVIISKNDHQNDENRDGNTHFQKNLFLEWLNNLVNNTCTKGLFHTLKTAIVPWIEIFFLVYLLHFAEVGVWYCKWSGIGLALRWQW